MSLPPLAVDLDGTLILTDTLHEAALRALRAQPLVAMRVPLWLAEGKAAMKQRLAAVAPLDAASLPYNLPLLAWLKEQRAQGRRLVLCTAADQSYADAIAAHLGLFDEVLASDGRINLSGEQKAARLTERFGAQGFDYAGNAMTDLPVWQAARQAIVVNASEAVAREAARVSWVAQVFDAAPADPLLVARTLRLHQWAKNLLLLVAPLAAHVLPDAAMAASLLLALLAFSLCASAVYVANDLFDLDSDRHHPRKRLRPFASGRVSVLQGVLIAPVLLIAAFILAWHASLAFAAWLGLYFVLTCAYSWGLKRLLIVDCLVLAMLYTLRIIAGAAAAGIPLSFWLMAFSVFLFLSLAFVKRYAELEVQTQAGRDHAHGRAYRTADAPLVQSLGVTAGYIAVLVLALYLNSEAVVKLYRTPEVIWAAVPVLMFWISHMWLTAHRGQMHDDPLLFAIRDKASLLAGAVFAAVLALGTRGWSW